MPNVRELEEIARRCRVDTIKALRCAQSGHPGSSLSAMDVMVALYHGGFLRHDPTEPDRTERDRFILSAGHAVPGLYSCLAHAGYAKVPELAGLRQFGTGLEGHAKRGTFPGVEASSGSLGQGLSIGVGLALAARLRASSYRVVVLTSDGEQQEGSTWEAVMSAAKWELEALTAIVDANGNQINGPVATVMPSLEPLPEKYRAFNWDVLEINGNDMGEVTDALEAAMSDSGPTAIVSRTVTGYPISFMMGDYHWHHGVITDELFLQAMEDLGEPVSATPDESWLPGSNGVLSNKDDR
jgi:transketolase